MTDYRLSSEFLETLYSGPNKSSLSGSFIEILGKESVKIRFTGTWCELLVPGVPIDFNPSAGSYVYNVIGTEEPVWHWDGTDLIPASIKQSI